MITWDVETHLIKQGLIMPSLVCVSYVNDDKHGLMDRQTGLARMKEWLSNPLNQFCGHHVQYDFGVLAAEDPSTFLPLIFRAYAEGRVHDTKIRQQLVDIANGELKFRSAEDGEAEDEDEEQSIQRILKTQYSLEALAWRLLRVRLPKEGTWRLKYALLKDTPIDRWPEEAKEYAIRDAVTTRDVFLAQQTRYTDVVFNNSAKQHQAAWSLHLMSAWGIRTDGEMVKKLKSHLEEEQAVAVKALSGTKILKLDGTRSMEAIRDRVVAGYTKNNMLEIPKTKTGKVSTAGDVLLASGDPDLKVLAESMKGAKLLNTYVPILEHGVKYPINATYNVLVETGRTSCSKPNCFDAETEILTKRGWVKFPELNSSEEIAQFHEDDGTIDFVVPTEHQRLQHKGRMVHLKNEHIDLLVTPDHRCLLQNRKLKYWKTFDADEYPEDWLQYNSGEYAWSTGLDLSDSELRLLIAVQADGYYHDNGFEFSFYKERKQKRFCEILNSSAIRYSVNDKYEKRYGGVDYKRYRVLASYEVDKITGYLGPEKKFGPWLLHMNKRQAKIFEEEIWHWDGCITRKNHYSSSVESNADWVQIVLSLMNLRAKKRLYRPDNSNAKDNFQIDVTRRSFSMTTNIERSVMDWDGLVYCVSVPSSYIMVRRNNCVMITGQCQNPPRKGGVRECFTARSGFVWGTVDFDTIELRTLAQTTIDMGCKYRFMADALCAGEDLHLNLAADVLGIDRKEAAKKYKAGDKVVDEYRQLCKIANFGYPGGMAARTFVEYAAGYGVKISQETAKGLHSAWKNAWREMEEYFEKIKEMIEIKDPVNDLPTICHFMSERFRGDVTFTSAANSFFQGRAADGAKDALWEVTRECFNTQSPLYGCHPVIFMHDEIVTEIPYADPIKASNAIKRQAEVMIATMQRWVPDIPITATPVLFRRWYKGAKPVYDQAGNILPSKPVTEEGKIKWLPDLEQAATSNTTSPSASTAGMLATNTSIGASASL